MVNLLIYKGNHNIYILLPLPSDKLEVKTKMSVQSYKTARKNAIKVNATIRHGIIQVYNQLVEDTRGEDGLIDPTKFNDSDYNAKAAKKADKGMLKFTKDFSGSGLSLDKAEDVMKLQSLQMAIGVDKAAIQGYLNQAGDQASVSTYMGHLAQRTNFGYFERQRTESPKAEITEADKDAVLKETGLEGRINKDAIDERGLQALMEHYMDSGEQVSPAFLRGLN